jgi:VIT1/CCC1 family predicted Fe2+/Mn2+ transporter
LALQVQLCSVSDVRPEKQQEHRIGRSTWLRAAVLGADDGVVSTASLIIGVSASAASKHVVLIAGVAGVVAGAMSMAAGEYVSVSSQRDVENADVALERQQLSENPRGELAELAAIYENRGLDRDLAKKVADQLSSGDRLKAHLRDELGLGDVTRARPLQAAVVSAISFTSLAVLQIFVVLIAPIGIRLAAVATTALASLAGLGALGGQLAGARRLPAARRVLLGGGLAMIVSALVGKILGGARF